MKKVLCFAMCLGMASFALALSITNGDFENQTGGYVADVVDWYDYAGSTLGYTVGPFFWGNGTNTINPSKLICMGSGANATETGGNHAYIYQSIGIYEGNPKLVEVELQWGLRGNGTTGQNGLTVMILESDGTFVPSEWDGVDDVYEADGITEIDRATVTRTITPGTAGAMYQKFLLDISGATVGNELFIRINDYRVGGSLWGVQIDNITMIPASVENQSPADGAIYVPVWRDSSGNDLVFNIADPDVTAVDILFGPENDPNLSLKPEYKIAEGMPVSQGLNTVTLETELAADLEYSTEYYWKVLAYEPNGMDLQLKYTGIVWSFTTIQEGPYLFEVTPSVQAVHPGQEAVFSVGHIKTDTFQWYKEGVGALSNGADYAGVDSNSLTVLNVQLEDEGNYYCIGTETSSGLTAQSLTSGGLSLKKLVTYYPFSTTYTAGSNTYTPDTISGKDAQLMGGATVNTAGDENSIAGGYLSLNNPLGATTQYATIADTSVAHHQDITISCWVRAMDLDYSWARVFDFGQSNTEYFFLTINYRQNYAAYNGLDAARCEFRHAGSNPEIDAIGDINANEWIFVVVTVEDGLGKIYLNGQYGEETNVPSPADITKTYNYIGKGIYTTTVPANFNGFIDEFKIYNYAQTKDEIAQEYLAVSGADWLCDMENYDLADWDFDNNCRVDMSDYAVIAAQWLNDFRIYRN